MRIPHDQLRNLITSIFSAAGCSADDAQCVSDHLVEANLAGHDSHGVIRTPIYVRWLGEGKVFANRQLEVIFENEVMALVDGQLGLGQSIAHQAMQMALDKSKQFGVSVVALRNSGHVGRVGHWAEMAVREGKIALLFVNTSGLGMLVAPIGGISRRLSANPLAVGIPVDNGPPIILDISTSSIAEGKLKVAFNKGVPVPDGCIIDSTGKPTNDPKVFYGDPPGAILPFGGHKGYGLGVVTEILAGALTGGGCTRPGKTQLEQGMLAIVLDPAVLQQNDAFLSDVRQFIEFVRSSEKVSPDADILMPGEIEQRNRAERMANGVELDDTTWSQLVEVAQSLSVQHELLQQTN